MRIKKHYKIVISILGTIILPSFILLPITFSVIVLLSKISVSTIILAIMFLSSSISLIVYYFQKRELLYTWCVFYPDCVVVKGLFQKGHKIVYTSCKSCGISYYRHAFMNSQSSLFGSNMYYLFFSIEPFDEHFRSCINLWPPSKTKLKVRFSKSVFRFLNECLPNKQKQMINSDFKRYFEKQTTR